MVYGLGLYCRVNLCRYITQALLSIDMPDSRCGPEDFNASPLYQIGTKYAKSCTEHVRICACV
jgi:hypothetical protein